jgi:hypothetical protein
MKILKLPMPLLQQQLRKRRRLPRRMPQDSQKLIGQL